MCVCVCTLLDACRSQVAHLFPSATRRSKQAAGPADRQQPFVRIQLIHQIPYRIIRSDPNVSPTHIWFIQPARCTICLSMLPSPTTDSPYVHSFSSTTQRKETNLIFKKKDCCQCITVRMGKKHQQPIVNHANIQGFQYCSAQFRGVRKAYRSQMQLSWKQQLEGAYTIQQRGKIGWRHWGNDGNAPRLAKLAIDSASHSSMSRLMLPKLCQQRTSKILKKKVQL